MTVQAEMGTLGGGGLRFRSSAFAEVALSQGNDNLETKNGPVKRHLNPCRFNQKRTR